MDKKHLTPADMKQREKYIKGMKKSNGGEFEKRYPGKGKEVMYATANKMAMKESYKDYFKQRLFENLLVEVQIDDFHLGDSGTPEFGKGPPPPPGALYPPRYPNPYGLDPTIHPNYFGIEYYPPTPPPIRPVYGPRRPAPVQQRSTVNPSTPPVDVPELDEIPGSPYGSPRPPLTYPRPNMPRPQPRPGTRSAPPQQPPAPNFPKPKPGPGPNKPIRPNPNPPIKPKQPRPGPRPA